MNHSVCCLMILGLVGCFSDRQKQSAPLAVPSAQIEKTSSAKPFANDKGQRADVLITINGQSSPFVRLSADPTKSFVVAARSLNFPYRPIVIVKVVPISADTSIENVSRNSTSNLHEILIKDLNTSDQEFPKFSVTARDISVCLASGISQEQCANGFEEVPAADFSRVFMMSDDIPSYMGLRKNLAGSDGIATTQKLYEGLMTSLMKSKTANADEGEISQSGFGAVSALVGSRFDALGGTNEEWGAYPGYGFDGLEQGGEYFHGPANESRSLSAWVSWFASFGGRSERKAKGTNDDAAKMPTAKLGVSTCTDTKAPWCFSQYAVYMDYGQNPSHLSEYFYETRLLKLEAAADGNKWKVWQDSLVEASRTGEMLR